MVEDRAKVTINGLYKVVHGLSIAAKMYDLNPSTGSSILLHQREAGVIFTLRILWCILLVLSGVLNANQLISPRRNASRIILLHPQVGIAIRHVCLFVRLCVRKHVLGRNILKTVGVSCSVTMEHL